MQSMHTMSVMDWPPQSPNINIIEAAWEHLAREQIKSQPTFEEDLWNVLQEGWRIFVKTIQRNYKNARLRLC